VDNEKEMFFLCFSEVFALLNTIHYPWWDCPESFFYNRETLFFHIFGFTYQERNNFEALHYYMVTNLAWQSNSCCYSIRDVDLRSFTRTWIDRFNCRYLPAVK
jgi:hypothetical protein